MFIRIKKSFGLKGSNRGNQKIREDNFVKIEKLGEGTYGTVYKAKDKRTNEVNSIR